LVSDVGSDHFLIPTNGRDKVSTRPEFVPEKIPHLAFDILRDPYRTLLGTGDHYVVVRPSAISFDAMDDKWHATMNANADQLKAAPEYKYSGKS
jgi:hypothetical protein